MDQTLCLPHIRVTPEQLIEDEKNVGRKHQSETLRVIVTKEQRLMMGRFLNKIRTDVAQTALVETQEVDLTNLGHSSILVDLTQYFCIYLFIFILSNNYNTTGTNLGKMYF